LKATVQEPSPTKRVLDIEIPSEEVDELYNQRANEYRRKVKLPGFRPGKVPIQIINSRFGPAIRAETVDELIQKSYQQACTENKLNPISRGEVSDLQAPEGEAVRLKIETEVDPEIEIQGYDKLKVKPSPRKIKGGDVDKAIEDLQQRLAEYNEIDRPIAKGDLATIEYQKVEIEGEEQTDFKSPNYPIEVGESKLKEFDKELIGKKAGETVEVTVKFPKNYGNETVAGKTGLFVIDIKKVQEKKLPELNDEFAKKLGEFESMDQLRSRVQEDLEKQELDRARSEAHEKAIDTLIKNNPFEVPEARIDAYIDYVVEEAGNRQQGGEPPSRDAIAQQYTEPGIRAIKRNRIIEYVAQKEKIKATQEEVDEQIRTMAQQYGTSFEEIKAALRKNGATNRIRNDIREKKTLDFLVGELQK
jgi:trigger factor